MVQVVGKRCLRCKQNIVFAEDGQSCKSCLQVFCNECFAPESCIGCNSIKSQGKPLPIDQLIAEARVFTAKQMNAGQSLSQIKANLQQKGLDDKTASAVIQHEHQLLVKSVASAGMWKLIDRCGSLFCRCRFDGLVLQVSS